MKFLDAVDLYFAGEKALGFALIPIGVAALAFGVWLWRGYGGGFGVGMGITLAVVGLLAAGGGAALAWTVGRRADALAAAHPGDPAAVVAQEVARMEKVNTNWPRLKIAWTVGMALAIAGLFLSRREWVTGIALAFILILALLFAVDTFAERRALIYTERIRAL